MNACSFTVLLLAAVGCSATVVPAPAPNNGPDGGAGPSMSGDTSCTDLCAKFATCGVAGSQCEATCMTFTSDCKSCLMQQSCSATASSCPACGRATSDAGSSSCTIATPCALDSDCPGNLHCNQKQGLCFHYDGSCVGQPCGGSPDCPLGETCNSATNTCN